MSRAFRFASPIYPIIDELDGRGRGYIELAEALLAGGVRFLQVRVKRRSTREFVEIARAVKTRTDRAGAQLIINDRVDVARLVDASGVHLGQEDLPVAAARAQLGHSKIIGFSTHNLAQARAAASSGMVDYIGVGPLFPTQSKANPDPVVGISGLRAARREVALPIVAIGGVREPDVGAVLAAGADAVAMIGEIVNAVDVPAKIRSLLTACGA